MDFNQALWLSVGGNAAMLGALAFFGKKMFDRVSAPEARRTGTALERAAAESASQADLHQAHFSRQHQARIAAVGELQARLGDVAHAIHLYAGPLGIGGGACKAEQHIRAWDALAALETQLDETRAGMTPALFARLENHIATVRRMLLELGAYHRRQDEGLAYDAGGNSIVRLDEDWKRAVGELPELRAALDREYRALLDQPG